MANQPKVSKDGRFWWDGEKWVPFADQRRQGLGDNWSPALRVGVSAALFLVVLLVVLFWLLT